MLQSIGKTLTAGGTTKLFTVPDGYMAVVELIRVTNGAGGSHDFSITWNNGTAVLVYPTTTLASKSTYTFGEKNERLVLHEGDDLSLTASASSDFTAIATLDITRTEKTPYNL
jgi:hypothetical protein